jgi:hypothetical protein
VNIRFSAFVGTAIALACALPPAFAQYIRDERNRIAALAKSAGIRID